MCEDGGCFDHPFPALVLPPQSAADVPKSPHPSGTILSSRSCSCLPPVLQSSTARRRSWYRRLSPFFSRLSCSMSILAVCYFGHLRFTWPSSWHFAHLTVSIDRGSPHFKQVTFVGKLLSLHPVHLHCSSTASSFDANVATTTSCICAFASLSRCWLGFPSDAIACT